MSKVDKVAKEDLVSNLVDTFGSVLQSGASALTKTVTNTVGKAVPLDKLVQPIGKEYFALKNGTLYWYPS